jgi:hypothetical protein
MTMRPLNDHVRRYEWRCAACRAINVEDDLRCWYCGAGVDGEAPGDVDVPRSTARSDADVVAALVDYLLTDFRYARGPITLIIDRLRERYGRRLVDRALGQWQRHVRQDMARMQRRQSEGL